MPCAQQQYDLLLRGGHVIDPKDKVSKICDVAIRDRKIAAVAPGIDPASAFKTVDVKGLYVTPGLVDIHVHAFASTGERNSYAGERSVYPDDFTLCSGVTTAADAGSSAGVIFRPFTKPSSLAPALEFSHFSTLWVMGCAGTRFERDLSDMEAKPTAEMALKFKKVIVGIKTAHYMGAGFRGRRSSR